MSHCLMFIKPGNNIILGEGVRSQRLGLSQSYPILSFFLCSLFPVLTDNFFSKPYLSNPLKLVVNHSSTQPHIV